MRALARPAHEIIWIIWRQHAGVISLRDGTQLPTGGRWARGRWARRRSPVAGRQSR